MAGSGIFYTVALANSAGDFVPSLTLATGDVKMTIMDAAGNMGALANAVILPVNEPAGSVIYKGEFDDTEIAAANVRDLPHIEVILIDQAGGEFRPVVYTHNGVSASSVRMHEVWQRLGLDPNAPLTTEENGAISVGNVTLTATTSGAKPTRTTIQTRQ